MMSNNPAELKATGLKATLPRLKILDIFQKNADRHLSAEDVYRLLLSENLEIGLATVYRVLTQFRAGRGNYHGIISSPAKLFLN